MPNSNGKLNNGMKAKGLLIASGFLFFTPIFLISLPTPDPAGKPIFLHFSTNGMHRWNEAQKDLELDKTQKFKILINKRPDFCRRYGAGFDAGVFNLNCYQKLLSSDLNSNKVNYIVRKCIYYPNQNSSNTGRYSCSSELKILTREESEKWKRFYGDNKPTRHEKTASEFSNSAHGLMFLLLIPLWGISGIFLLIWILSNIYNKD